MSNRFKNADHIWNGGASNPRAVARALVNAIDEAVEEGGGTAGAKDGAVQMILDHLCFLCGLPQPSIEVGFADWNEVLRIVHIKSQKDDRK